MNNWNEMEKLWQRQPLGGAASDLALLRETFEAKRRKTTRLLFLRDVGEGGVGLVLAGTFFRLAWRLGFAGWPMFAGATIIAMVSGVFLFDLYRRKRFRVGPETPLLARLEAETLELRHQRRLLLSLGAWYFLPLVAAIALIGTSLTGQMVKHAPPGFVGALLTTMSSLLCIIILFASVTWAIGWAWRVNRREIRARLEPRLAELEELRRDLLSSAQDSEKT